ncbi:17862_t:CDS:1 [Funneliformis geosporum]|nr:17862_t:CDS:1 [Funneliformis geosporum]
MASNNFQKCIKCYHLQEKSSFISKTGRKLKTCKICRDQSSDFYIMKKSGNNNHETDDEMSPFIMQEIIFNKINAVSQNDFMENEHLGLDFTCVLSTNLLEGTSQEKARQIVKIITKGDRYHYM